MTLILFALAIWFIPCNISELYNYKLYREFNNKTINDIISLISQDEFKDKKPVIVAYNVDILPKAISNHFAATIQMGWALMGEIQVKNGHTNIGKIMSIQREKAQDLVDSYKDKDYILIEEINNYFIRRK
jgi:hypothetical protein